MKNNYLVNVIFNSTPPFKYTFANYSYKNKKAQIINLQYLETYSI